MQLPAVLKGENRRTLANLLVIALLMFGFGYALVPIYKRVCQALGLNVLSVTERGGVEGGSKVPGNTLVDTSRTVTVEFDANARGPWQFKPAVRVMRVHPGELATVVYEFQNVQGRTMSAQAIPSYAPQQAGAHFNKLECFCFNEYTLAPGEKKRWPVVFYLDPKLPRDVTTITLSYTFFEVGGKMPAAPRTALAPTGGRG